MNGLITSSDITKIVPYHVIEYLIEGVMKVEKEKRCKCQVLFQETEGPRGKSLGLEVGEV